MPNVGYCHDCGEWVYVRADWSCPNGHAAARVNGWYNSDSGKPIAPSKPASNAARTSGRGVREAFLADLITALSHYPAYTTERGADTDLRIVSNPVDSIWATGTTRSEYSAALKVEEPQRAVYFWESLKLRGTNGSLGAPGSDLDGGTDRTSVEPAIASSQEWGYGTTRRVVEEVASRHGLGLKTVLRKSSALW